MKNNLKKILTVIVAGVILLGILVPAAASYIGTEVYKNTVELARGLKYENVIISTSAGRQESFILELNPGSDVRAVVTDCGKVRSGTTINGAVSYAETLGYNTLAAINADFFTMSNGVPTGVIIENGILVSTDDGQNAVGFRSDGTAFLGAPKIRLEAFVNALDTPFKIDHFNKMPSAYTFNLLSRDFATTFSLSGTWKAAVLEPVSGEMILGGSVTFKVIEMTEFSGSFTIPDGCMILVAKAETTAAERFAHFTIGDELLISILYSDMQFGDAVWAVGGGDILISDGEITPSDGWDSNIASRNPRTALGIKADGTIVLCTADGRQSSYSVGLTLSQLAGELLSYGCEYAINFDGGGSTAMAVRRPGDSTANVVNSPSAGSLRACGTYVILVTDNSSDGTAHNLFIENDGALVLPNSQLPLGAVLATDSGYKTVSAPDSVDMSVNELFGSVSDNIFYTGTMTGTANITLSGNGASGSGKIFITDSLTAVKIQKDGKTVSSIQVSEGDEVQITTYAEYWGRKVWSMPENFNYSVPAGVGSISPTGYIKTGALSAGTGQITVSYNALSETIPIYITPKFHDISSHWAEDFINRLGEDGIVNGVITDGKRYYHPDEMITREEFFTILARALKLDASAYSGVELPFADVGKISGWALDSIKALYSKGILTGSLDDGKLYACPKNDITRQEAFLTLSRLKDREYDEDAVNELLSEFSDAGDIAAWAKNGVYELVRSGVVNGYTDGTILPKNNITRAETAKIIRLYM